MPQNHSLLIWYGYVTSANNLSTISRQVITLSQKKKTVYYVTERYGRSFRVLQTLAATDTYGGRLFLATPGYWVDEDDNNNESSSWH